MTLRVLVVDDEPIARRRLKAILRDEPDVEVIGECEDGEDALEAARRLAPDLLFLDIEMPGLDGFQVVASLGDACPAVVFVTAYDKYAVKAFEVHAVDYVLKPFEGARVRAALRHARTLTAGDEGLGRRLQALVADLGSRRPLRRLLVRTEGRVYFVRTEEIGWIEAAGHYVTLHAGRELHLVRETLSGLETRLDPQRFTRIHRSTIVSIEHVRELQPSFHGEYAVLLRDGTRLHCSRTYADRLQRALGGG